LAQHVQGQLSGGQTLSAPPLRSVSRSESLPLSFAQQRLWLLNQLEPDSASYHIPATIYLKGPLDKAVLRQTIEEIVRRHEVLRTTFKSTDGLPVQVIHESASLNLPVVDLSHLPEVEREAAINQYAHEESQRRFDLMRGPLLRAEILALAEEENILLLTMHHIVSDGWSVGILVREVAALYEAFLSQQESPLDPLPFQYADFAVWQRAWLQGKVLDDQLTYWRGQLENAPPVFE